MKDKGAKTAWLTIVALALTALLLFTACAPGLTAPAGEEKVVEIGAIVALTGPVGGPCSYPFYALQDYLDYFDDENGIPGVTLELVWVDGATIEDREISAYRRFVDRGIPFIISITEAEMFRACTEKDEIPIICLAQTEGIMYPPCWLYSIYVTWAESYAVWCEWIVDNWKGDRPPRVVVLGPDTVAGPHAIEPARSYVENLGIEMLPSEFVAGYAPLDTSSELLRIEQNGADYVYIVPLWSLAAIVLRDAARLGLVSELRFGGLENTQGLKLLEQVGASAEGYTSPRTGPWVGETQIPGMKLLHDLRPKYGRPYDFAGDEQNGTVAIMVACEVVKRALEEVGYENLDGVAIKRTLDSMKDFDCDGIKRITYTPEDHRGWNRARIYQVQDGDVVPISDWLEAPMITP
jgi:ABC-type branched-subunit amino acid transport system substrate-binding protein